MRRIRVIPVLLLENNGLVKTIRFKKRTYIGDPINSVKILNDKEVDELVLLDIQATRRGDGPNITLITEIAGECFMPLAYGGGITNKSQITALFKAGIEKVIVNAVLFEDPQLIRWATDVYGSQSVVVSIDARSCLFGGYRAVTHGGSKKQKMTPVEAAIFAEQMGAGEIFINAVDKDGSMGGYDLALIRDVSTSVSVPVIACGGASNTGDFVAAIKDGQASAVAAGSMFVFQGVHRAVLMNYPDQNKLVDEVFKKITKNDSPV